MSGDRLSHISIGLAVRITKGDRNKQTPLGYFRSTLGKAKEEADRNDAGIPGSGNT
jgi:hypothetical protein